MSKAKQARDTKYTVTILNADNSVNADAAKNVGDKNLGQDAAWRECPVRVRWRCFSTESRGREVLRHTSVKLVLHLRV